MHHGEAKESRRSARRDAEVVTSDMGVVQAQQLDREPVQLNVSSDVREVVPAVGHELRRQVARPPALRAAGAPFTAEVGQVVQGSRREVVVRTKDEPRREASLGRADGGDGRFDGFRFGQEVARDHRDVRRRQARQERGLARIDAHEMQVGQVEHRQGSRCVRR